MIAGGKDYVVPGSVTKSNVNLFRKSKAATDYKEFPNRSHYTIGEKG